jgi:hypothetical protein
MSAPVPKSRDSTREIRPAAAQSMPPARRGGSTIAFSVSGMTRHRPTRIRTTARRAIATTASALAVTAVAAVTANPASAAASTQAVPAAGAVVTCDGVGALTGTSGYLRQRETTTVDGRGRAHVLFTIATDRVELAGADGTRYRLTGAGFDHVLYPGGAVTGDILREHEQFHFDVTTGDHIVGVVRFRLHTGTDQIPHVRDASTCQLPNLS